MLPPVDITRFWLPSGTTPALDETGFLRDPELWSGAQPNSLVTTDQLPDSGLVVLLGEPGAGKSTEIDRLATNDAEGEVVAVRLIEHASEERLERALRTDAVARWRSSTSSRLVLLVDGLDEAILDLPVVARILADEINTWPPDRFCVVLACRTAAWEGEVVTGRLTQLGDPAEYELLPLARGDAAHIAESRADADRAESFLRAVAAAGSSGLIARPQPLDLLLKVYLVDPDQPMVATDLYRRALPVLVEELNPDRRAVAKSPLMPVPHRLAIARWLAAAAVFGNVRTIWPGAEDPTLMLDATPVSELCVGSQPLEVGGDVALTSDGVLEVLDTALFTGAGGGALRWAHWTLAEHLAAEFVAQSDLSKDAVESLFCSETEGQMGVYPQLGETAWRLVGLDPDRFAPLVAADPVHFATSSVDLGDPVLKEVVVSAVLADAATGRQPTRSWMSRFSNLDFEGVSDHLQVIGDKSASWETRAVALEIARDSRIPGLTTLIESVLVDPSDDVNLRTRAAHVVQEVGVSDPEVLRQLLVSKSGAENNDEFRGTALRFLWPDHISLDELIAAFDPLPESNLYGAFSDFIQKTLPPTLTVEHLEGLLAWLASLDLGDRPTILDTLSDAIVRLALRSLDHPGVIEALVPLLARRSREHRGLLIDSLGPLGGDPDRSTVEIPAEERKELLIQTASLLADYEVLALVANGLGGLEIAHREDLPWLLSEWDEEGDAGRRAAIARLSAAVFSPGEPGHPAMVFDLPDDHELRTGTFARWIEPQSRDTELARIHRELAQDKRESKTPARPPLGRISKLEELVSLAEGGAPEVLTEVQALISAERVEQYPGVPNLETDLSAVEGWLGLPPELQARVLELSVTYLAAASCDLGNYLSSSQFNLSTITGYRAMVLLEQERPSDLDALKESQWKEWAPLVVASPASRVGEDDLQLSLVRRAKPFALAEMRSTVVEALGSATDRAPLVNAEVVSEIVDAEFCAQLATLADGGSVRVSEFLLGILAASCLDEAKGLMVGILTDSSAGRAEQLAAIKTLLDYTPDTAWETVGPALRGDGGRELAAQIAYFDRPVPPISVEHLGELYEVLCHHYPPEDDPPAKGGAVSPEQSARWWRDAVLRALRDRGSSEAVVVLRSLVVKMPGRPWLQTAVDHAVGVLRQTSWTALSPAEIHRLVLEPRARIVRSLPQLARVVEHALDDIADRLKGATPEGVLLWNDAKLQRPKSEGAFSDYLANRLRDALQGRRIVVNREVEIRPRPTGVGERTDLLVQAASSAEDLLQLPIEVKGCWHRDVLTAMEGQLYAQYMVDLGVDVGVYLVGWFPVDDWTDTSDRNRARQARLGTQVELLEVLEQQSAGLKSKRAVAITPRVLAVPYTRLEEED